MKRTIILPTEYLNDGTNYLTPDQYHNVCGDWNDGIRKRSESVQFDYESDIETYKLDDLRIAELEVPEEVYETEQIGKHDCRWKPCQVPIESIRKFTVDDLSKISTSWMRNDL